jgi:hypothetical protein
MTALQIMLAWFIFNEIVAIALTEMAFGATAARHD